MLVILLLIFALIISAVFHEYAHGWTAYKLGDSTAKDLGRLTFGREGALTTLAVLAGALTTLEIFVTGFGNFVTTLGEGDKGGSLTLKAGNLDIFNILLFFNILN